MNKKAKTFVIIDGQRLPWDENAEVTIKPYDHVKEIWGNERNLVEVWQRRFPKLDYYNICKGCKHVADFEFCIVADHPCPNFENCEKYAEKLGI